ncbi:cysteine desulfurase family protein [Acinetobacter sp.]|uniref:cysteine desulfurase family protein n=1 Tax=Acinetobacter sp. TaxID=472 RepID=UPI0012C10634|nr:cysteine desulfurase family protein [Acinetobacter sp.]MPS62979.1 cysteine desulfurase [Acinetobacter sp.]
MLYFDNHATTHVDPEIFDIFQNIECDLRIGNPHSSEHENGWNADNIINQSLEIFSNLLNCICSELIFTSGATEANNLAIIGLSTKAYLNKLDKNKIIISAIEHASVRNSAYQVSKLFGFEIIEIPITKEGVINLDILKESIDGKTLLVTCMAVNNEIGTIQPIKEISKICRKYNTIFHIDAAQAGYLLLEEIIPYVDSLSLSGHKIYAPKGIGLLYINKYSPLTPEPIIHGGNQQNGMRSGTLSPALCLSFAKAYEKLCRIKELEINKLRSHSEYFYNLLAEKGIKFKIHGNTINRHPGNLNFSIDGIDARLLIMRLQPRVAISTGSACYSGQIESSHVLKALDLSSEEILSTLRIGLGRFNTSEQIFELVEILCEEVQKIMN